jgi:hypothetical protein
MSRVRNTASDSDGDDAVENDEPECGAPGELAVPARGEGAQRASREVGADVGREDRDEAFLVAMGLREASELLPGHRRFLRPAAGFHVLRCLG